MLTFRAPIVHAVRQAFKARSSRFYKLDPYEEEDVLQYQQMHGKNNRNGVE